MKVTVLLVDDDAKYRRSLTAFLDASYDIDVVADTGDGEEAVALAERLRPDAAIVDVAMPDQDGLVVAGRLKAAVPGIAILLVTGNVWGVDRDRVDDLAVEGLLHKGDPLPVENALIAIGRRPHG
jgi:DNA-binding NarL/FixJ family response regulator